MGRNWNEEFQVLVEKSFTDSELEFKRTQALRHVFKYYFHFFLLIKLCEEFAISAASTGKTIISELWAPLEQKTISPITNVVGGVAGYFTYFYS